MARPFKLPDLGEGIHEAEVLNVLVSVGDHVNEGDSILEVETDKATAEIPSPFTGKVEEIKVKPGETVEVGDVLLTFSDIEGEGEAKPLEEEAPPEKEKVEKPEKVEEKEKAERREEEEEKKKPLEKEREGPVPASPATRRLARELSVDLHEVSPSGPGGRVTSDDVRAFAEKAEEKVPPEAREKEKAAARPIEEKAPELPDFTRWGELERIPVRSIRRATAKQMALAWSQIPHVYNQDMVDMTKLDEFRRKHKKEVEEKGGKLSVTVFALKAAATALKKHPRFNASLDIRAGEMVLKQYYHVGVAVNTEEGLVVPVVRDVDRKSIVELSVELNDLVRRTRERQVKLEEMQGGTFTITNVGPMGGGYFAPIINFPEVAILGMGAARMQAMVIEQEEGKHEVVPRLMMPVVLSIDHRILDGADALLFMRTLIDSLEDPEEMFITMT
ncbi:MAG: dihydrolipoamide acetyltransferase family protein [Deltaproteobacteria bacterium]|jgi:pyruvate dehydrogenase E2 component (dihydrolipoamide acetyltransferase)